MDDTGDFDDDAEVRHKPSTIQRLKIVISLSDAKSVARDQYSRVADHLLRLSPKIGVWDKPPNFRDLKNYENPFAWAVESYSRSELTELYNTACSRYLHQIELDSLCKTLPPGNTDRQVDFLPQPDPFREIPPSGTMLRPETFVPHSFKDVENFFVSSIKNCYLDRPNVGLISVGRGRGRRWVRVLLSCKELHRHKLPQQTDTETLQTTFASPQFIGKKEQFDEIGRVPFYRTIWQGPGWYAIRRLCQNEWCQNLAHMVPDIIVEQRDRCPGGSHCLHTRRCMNVGPKFFTNENKAYIEQTLKQIKPELGFWKVCMDYAVAKETGSDVAVPMLSDTDTMSTEVRLEHINEYMEMTATKAPSDIKNSYVILYKRGDITRSVGNSQEQASEVEVVQDQSGAKTQCHLC